jgi:hypothetical protein
VLEFRTTFVDSKVIFVKNIKKLIKKTVYQQRKWISLCDIWVYNEYFKLIPGHDATSDKPIIVIYESEDIISELKALGLKSITDKRELTMDIINAQMSDDEQK